MKTFKPLLYLMPYLWPKNNKNFKIRLILAICFLIFAKLANVSVPIFLGKAVDSLDGLNKNSLIIFIPIVFIAAYGIARFLHVGFGEIRDALFARIGQNAIRRVALKIFEHLKKIRNSSKNSCDRKLSMTTISGSADVYSFSIFPHQFFLNSL